MSVLQRYSKDYDNEEVIMTSKFDPSANREITKAAIGYVPLNEANEELYKQIGFMCGLEVHQQLKTREKLFCRCPSGIYHKFDDYDAEVIRHMRPTLSELGEYDGTALMEFRTKKNITYHLNYQTACTYDIDDTPPFKLNKQAMEIATEISLMLKLNIVGELHVIRKQYLDGSIPTGFQRTGIIGIEGEIPLKNKTVRIMQLSIEEDSCREASDYRHERVYTTDRLGTPLIETVTYPDLLTPWEAAEACHYIRFLARSTGKVEVGSGAGREDVNVSVPGGTRVEIKGVSHISWIPRLTHNEAFRQRALLEIKKRLLKRISEPEKWSIKSEIISPEILHNKDIPWSIYTKADEVKFFAVNLPDLKGLLSFFTQPGKVFANEISDRLKVIACLERPNMWYSEELEENQGIDNWNDIREILGSGDNDAQIVFWAPEFDVQTALETIEERIHLAMEGVPNETRKSFADGTTIFERVLPGPDRMYPDTDSAPISIEESFIEKARAQLPVDVNIRMQQLAEWAVPTDTWTYLLRNNLIPIIEEIADMYQEDHKYLATLLGHQLKHIEGALRVSFPYQRLCELFAFTHRNRLKKELIPKMLPIICENPHIEFSSVLEIINFEKSNLENLLELVPSLSAIFKDIQISFSEDAEFNWIMGTLRKSALGNVELSELAKGVKEMLGECELSEQAILVRELLKECE